MSRSQIQQALDALHRLGIRPELAQIDAGVWLLSWRADGAVWSAESAYLDAIGDSVLAWLDAVQAGDGGEDRYARRIG